ncbi:glutamyl-tRNA reductase [Actinomyces sp. 2119]|uniref:glutamyl-tRNA reductase n=1 Tax=Actinomyces sp. 2119 TaxID=2321393 RepID=UPI000E6CA181|nr:glutamyl-tRNA reductase [Actinomyces sp. 2119]RJF41190.1 glutamyl-tRNA reductase [Actinomyces sp. 2119]
MAIYFISADHRFLDLETVSRLGAVAPGLGKELVDLLPGLRGAMVLATCNRLSLLLDSRSGSRADFGSSSSAPCGVVPGVYGGGTVDDGGGDDSDKVAGGAAPEAPGSRGEEQDSPPVPDGLAATLSRVSALMARRSGLERDDLAWASWEGAQAYRELFATASGLESMVVGERQIAGQVRRALGEAEREGTLSPDLVRVVEHALVVSRRVAAETSVVGRGRSLAAVGVDLVAQELPPLSRCRVLLAGTGSYAGATVSVLRERGAADVTVYSASHRAQSFAQGHGLRALDPDGLQAALATVDLVITCRGRGAPVLTRDQVARATAQRLRKEGGNRPLTLLDLSLVRDVERGVEELPGVVYTGLERIQSAVPEAGTEDLAAARAIVAQETEAFERFLRGRRMDGLITGLRSQVNDMVAQEAARLRPVPAAGRRSAAGGTGSRGGAGGEGVGMADGGAEPSRRDDEDGEALVTVAEAQQALRRLAARLLHHPTVAARRAGQDGREEDFRVALETVLGPEVAGGVAAGPRRSRSRGDSGSEVSGPVCLPRVVSLDAADSDGRESTATPPSARVQ